MDTLTAVKERLLELCDRYGFSLNQLAVRANVPPSTVKNIIYGKSLNPGIVTLKQLCDGLGISLAEFFDCADFRQVEDEIE